MVQIYSSRHTPGVTGDYVHFQKGEVIGYLTRNGIVKATIDSERMTHERCPTFGYECIFHDTNERGFADGARIVEWEGKVSADTPLE